MNRPAFDDRMVQDVVTVSNQLCNNIAENGLSCPDCEFVVLKVMAALVVLGWEPK